MVSGHVKTQLIAHDKEVQFPLSLLISERMSSGMHLNRSLKHLCDVGAMLSPLTECWATKS